MTIPRSSLIKNLYSQKKNNGLVTPDDLFSALKYQSDIDSFPLPPHFSIVDVMKTWTENQGYPLLNLARNYQNGNIEIEQVCNHL